MKKKGAKSNGPRRDGHPTEGYKLRLYVAGQTPKSLAALSNLKRICAEHIGPSCEIEVIDLLKDPARANHDQIVAIPTLVRQLPEPFRKIIGDLSDTERVLIGLDVLKLEERLTARGVNA